MPLYTIGYEGHTLESFIARLKAAAVETLIDVRQLPLSRKRGFSKKSLSSALSQAGIAYVHMPALGCPKLVRDAYRQDKDWTEYTRAFHAHLTTQEAAVRDAAALAKEATACLMCFEADFNYCHRTYVARAAEAQGAPNIRHI